jgi:putative NADPH-quinone reductase
MAAKRVLIIIANPRENSFSHQLADAYLDGAIEAGKSVKTLDLYASDLQLDFLRPETKAEFAEQQAIREELQQMVYDAQELVIIHPLWWGGPPAILKNFIDQVFTPGFAYRYKRRSHIPRRFDIMPQRLLKGRHVRLFVTADGQRWTNAVRLMPWLMTWNMYIFRFTGLKLRSVRLFDFMRNRSAMQRSKWLAQVAAMARK